MCRILIFGGTTEGRQLAEYCKLKNIPADVSVATEYGAEMLTENEFVRILTGRLSTYQMQELMCREKYILIIDATHPYAAEVTANIRKASENTGIPYYRLIRKTSPVSYGERTYSIDEMISLLNENDDIILSTLGTKELDALTAVKDHFRRIWVRALPSEELAHLCEQKGFDRKKLILEQGPFSEKQNLKHICESGAGILITKESGSAGGFDEKAVAAEKSGIRLITLARPVETGYLYEEILKILEDGI